MVDFFCTFALTKQMVVVAQSVRASGCGSEGRGFDPHHPPKFQSGLSAMVNRLFFAVNQQFSPI